LPKYVKNGKREMGLVRDFLEKISKEEALECIVYAVKNSNFSNYIKVQDVERIFDIKINQQRPLDDLIPIAGMVRETINEVIWDLVAERILTPAVALDTNSFLVTDKERLESKI
jgi:hypothetical protein